MMVILFGPTGRFLSNRDIEKVLSLKKAIESPDDIYIIINIKRASELTVHGEEFI